MSIFLTHQKKWGHFHQTWTPCVMTYDCKLHPLGTSSALHSFIENGFSFEASRLDWPKCHHQTDTPTMYLPQPRNALRWKLHEHGCRYDSRQHHNQKFTVPKSSGTWLKYILGCFKSEKKCKSRCTGCFKSDSPFRPKKFVMTRVPHHRWVHDECRNRQDGPTCVFCRLGCVDPKWVYIQSAINVVL